MIIRAQGIEKSFGALKVLKGIDFEAQEAEVVSIMGASGAGKSTLLQILGTLSTPDAGTLEIDGTDVLRLGSRELSAFRNRRIGFVFQFHHLLPEFTSLENVLIPAYIAGRKEPEARKEALALLEDLGLAERVTHKPSELSGGEQQRISIARALCKNPKILLCDEPTGALDSETGVMVLKLLLEMARNYGKTIVVVTHNQNIAKMADVVIRVKNGTIRSIEEQENPLRAEEVEW